MGLTHRGLSCIVAVRQWSQVDTSSFMKRTAKPQKSLRCTTTFKLPHTKLSSAKRVCVSSSWLLFDTEEYISRFIFQGQRFSKELFPWYQKFILFFQGAHETSIPNWIFTKTSNIVTEGRMLKIASTNNCLRHHPSL